MEKHIRAVTLEQLTVLNGKTAKRNHGPHTTGTKTQSEAMEPPLTHLTCHANCIFENLDPEEAAAATLQTSCKAEADNKATIQHPIPLQNGSPSGMALETLDISHTPPP